MAKNFDPEIGKGTRWRKGQRSPNPGGRPRSRVVSAYLRQALERGDAEKIGRSLLNLAKKGNMRAISEVMDRTEGKATQTLEVAVEKSKPASPDFENMSEDEVIESLVGPSVDLIEDCLDCLNNEHVARSVQLREAAPRLRELQQGLTSLVESLAEGGVPSILENSELVKNENRRDCAGQRDLLAD
jgi:DNA-binding phage protein